MISRTHLSMARDLLEPHDLRHTLMTAKYTDSYSPHIDIPIRVLFKGRGEVHLFHGDGTTANYQVNDTDMHQHIKKVYKKYMSSKNTDSTAEE